MGTSPQSRICVYPDPVPGEPDRICGQKLSGRGRHKYCPLHGPRAREELRRERAPLYNRLSRYLTRYESPPADPVPPLRPEDYVRLESELEDLRGQNLTQGPTVRLREVAQARVDALAPYQDPKAAQLHDRYSELLANIGGQDFGFLRHVIQQRAGYHIAKHDFGGLCLDWITEANLDRQAKTRLREAPALIRDADVLLDTQGWKLPQNQVARLRYEVEYHRQSLMAAEPGEREEARRRIPRLRDLGKDIPDDMCSLVTDLHAVNTLVQTGDCNAAGDLMNMAKQRHAALIKRVKPTSRKVLHRDIQLLLAWGDSAKRDEAYSRITDEFISAVVPEDNRYYGQTIQGWRKEYRLPLPKFKARSWTPGTALWYCGGR